MKESTYRVLEFTREDLERLVKEALSSEFQKMMGMINNIEGNKTKSDLMTREEVSKLLNVSLVTLHNWEMKKMYLNNYRTVICTKTFYR